MKEINRLFAPAAPFFAMAVSAGIALWSIFDGSPHIFMFAGIWFAIALHFYLKDGAKK